MNIIAQKAIAVLENRLVKTAAVLATREWEPATFIEIDLHIPGCDMTQWREVQHIKCKVGVFTYRDYTPSCWDAETQTCTLFIDTAHDGPGSRWAKALRAGDPLFYMGISSAHHEPARDKRMVLLGDETSVGHFLAFRQLAGKGATIDGAITLTEEGHRHAFADYFPDAGLQALPRPAAGDYRRLEEWAGDLPHADPANTVFYLAGYIPAVVGLRKLLKRKGYGSSQVKAQGFWE